jgi:hypothetical protein
MVEKNPPNADPLFEMGRLIMVVVFVIVIKLSGYPVPVNRFPGCRLLSGVEASGTPVIGYRWLSEVEASRQ